LRAEWMNGTQRWMEMRCARFSVKDAASCGKSMLSLRTQDTAGELGRAVSMGDDKGGSS
jgi:hypothetical protein